MAAATAGCLSPRDSRDNATIVETGYIIFAGVLPSGGHIGECLPVRARTYCVHVHLAVHLGRRRGYALPLDALNVPVGSPLLVVENLSTVAVGC